jgi:hypothetical protein
MLGLSHVVNSEPPESRFGAWPWFHDADFLPLLG